MFWNKTKDYKVGPTFVEKLDTKKAKLISERQSTLQQYIDDLHVYLLDKLESMVDKALYSEGVGFTLQTEQKDDWLCIYKTTDVCYFQQKEIDYALGSLAGLLSNDGLQVAYRSSSGDTFQVGSLTTNFFKTRLECSRREIKGLPFLIVSHTFK